MKVALCLHGLVGNISKKSGEKDNFVQGGKGYKRAAKSKELVLDLAHLHWDKYILSPKENDIDIFIHSWDVNLKDYIVSKFNPKSYFFEKQVVFDMPYFIYQKYKLPASSRYDYNISLRAHKLNRIQNHYSKWYSFEKSIDLALEYGKNNNIKYDCIMGSRFDVAIKKEIVFDKYNMDCIWKVGGPPWDGSLKVQDHLFFSNEDKMEKFKKLYGDMNFYLRQGKMCPVRISNHRLARRHIAEVLVGKLRPDDFIKRNPGVSDKDYRKYCKKYKRSFRHALKQFTEDDGLVRNAFYESVKDSVNDTECPLVRQLYFNHTRHEWLYTGDVEGRLVDINNFRDKYL